MIAPSQKIQSHPDRGGGRRMRASRVLLTPLLLAGAAGLSGCEVDDWLYNPSTVGRWNHTPTAVPILEQIDVIESGTGQYADVTQVTPEDLIAEPRDYTIAPGDVARVQVLDLLPGGAPLRDDYLVDQRGFVNIPLLDPVRVNGMTAQEAQRAISDAIVQADILDAPNVNVVIVGQRQATLSIFGAIPGVGRYGIPHPDYRLMDALTDAGGVSPLIPKVYVIRQVPLGESIGPDRPSDRPSTRPARPGETVDDGEDLLQIIEQLTRPEDGAPASPGVLGSDRSVGALPIDLPDPTVGLSALSDARGHRPARVSNASSSVAMSARQPEPMGEDPIIDLVDDDMAPVAPRSVPQAAPEMSPMPGQPGGAAKWVFLNGEWVRVIRVAPSQAQQLPEAADPLAGSPSATGELVTQRVIEIPVAPLLQGVAQYNIVIRPGDVISVPTPDQGNVYVGGPGISRPGTYNLPFAGRLTLMRLVMAAGGLNSIGIPERVDLTRMIGTDRQATVRLNLKAIFEGTQPDIFIKADDMLNFGTNFWATPLAVIRNGFRMSYGFGFLLDRNFGNDVFGPPPSDDGFN